MSDLGIRVLQMELRNPGMPVRVELGKHPRRAYGEEERCRAMPDNACRVLVGIQKASQRPTRLDKAYQAGGDCQGWGPIVIFKGACASQMS